MAAFPDNVADFPEATPAVRGWLRPMSRVGFFESVGDQLSARFVAYEFQHMHHRSQNARKFAFVAESARGERDGDLYPADIAAFLASLNLTWEGVGVDPLAALAELGKAEYLGATVSVAQEDLWTARSLGRCKVEGARKLGADPHDAFRSLMRANADEIWRSQVRTLYLAGGLPESHEGKPVRVAEPHRRYRKGSSFERSAVRWKNRVMRTLEETVSLVALIFKIAWEFRVLLEPFVGIEFRAVKFPSGEVLMPCGTMQKADCPHLRVKRAGIELTWPNQLGASALCGARVSFDEPHLRNYEPICKECAGLSRDILAKVKSA